MDNAREIHNNYDAIFKEALILYKNKTLDFLGLDLAMIEEPINTTMTEMGINEHFTNMCFMLKDKTGLHIELEADISFDDMLRFCSYNLNYMRMYKTDFTTVVFTNKKQNITCFENEMIKFNPVIINLGEKDGDAVLHRIEMQIQNKEPVNHLELVYLPLYHSKYMNMYEKLVKVIELAQLISKSNSDSEKIMLMSVILAKRFMDEKDFNKIWFAVKLYIDGKAEGKKSSKVEIVEILLKKGKDIETIAEYTRLSADEIELIKNNIVIS